MDKDDTKIATEEALWQQLAAVDPTFTLSLAEVSLHSAGLAKRAQIFLNEGTAGMKKLENDVRECMRGVYLSIARKLGSPSGSTKVLGVVGQTIIRKIEVKGNIVLSGKMDPRFAVLEAFPDVLVENSWHLNFRYSCKNVDDLIHARETVPNAVKQALDEFGLTAFDTKIGNLFPW